MNQTLNEDHLRKIMAQVVEKTFLLDEPWEWPCGVAYYGVAEACALTGSEEWLAGLKERVDERVALGVPPWTVNTCAMGHSLLALYEATGDSRYDEILQGALRYLREEAPRFGDRVLQHTVSVNNDFPEQAWADTLFMAAFLMLRAGVRDGDPGLIEDALHQYASHIQYLQDKATGLWYHGYDHKAQNNLSGFFWGRANAWAAYTLSQVKRFLKEPYLYPAYMDITCSLRDQLAALKNLQTPDGLWRTLLDDPEAYEELSASCGIAAAMAEHGNPLHSACLQRAAEGILRNISPEGRLLNVSGGTAVMRDREGYRRISRQWTQGWGQGLALAFLTGLLRRGGRHGV